MIEFVFALILLGLLGKFAIRGVEIFFILLERILEKINDFATFNLENNKKE